MELTLLRAQNTALRKAHGHETGTVHHCEVNNDPPSVDIQEEGIRKKSGR